MDVESIIERKQAREAEIQQDIIIKQQQIIKIRRRTVILAKRINNRRVETYAKKEALSVPCLNLSLSMRKGLHPLHPIFKKQNHSMG